MNQFEYQSPIKTTGNCFRCHQPGHWAQNCKHSPANRSPITPNRSPVSVSEFPQTHCPCGAGFCEILVSKSKDNPNRKYYRCPGKNENYCEYFWWCDMMKKEDILVVQPKKYPICGCGAGVCRVEIERSGSNAGRSCYVCPIKKGYGACSFRKRMDDASEESELPLEEYQELNYLSPEVEIAIDASVDYALDFSSEIDQVQFDNRLDWSSDVADRISSGSPGLHLHSVGNNILASENVEASVITAPTTVQDPISPGFNHLNMPEDKLPSESSLNLSELPKQPMLQDKQKESMFETLEKLSLCLQNDFVAVSKSASPNYHENVIKQDCTFTPQDFLRADYELFHLQIIECIKQTTAHARIEQAIKDDAPSKELLAHYKKEKSRFEKIFHSFSEALKAYMASSERLISTREELSRIKDILTELEEEEACCEMETTNCKQNLFQITKNMSECKESMQNAYEELEDALKLHRRK